jgi:thiol-disulfide isomerase/thioredoxin
LVRRGLVWLLAFAAIAVAAIVLVPLFVAPGARPAGPQGLVGEPAPVFALANDRGTPVSLEQYRGKVVVMNLWASWCPPCRAEMPDLQRLSQAYASRGVAVVGVNEGESPERAGAFAGALGIRFPIWIDGQQQYGRVFSALGMPTTAIVDRNGVIAQAFDGQLTYGEMQKAVAGLLNRT